VSRTTLEVLPRREVSVRVASSHCTVSVHDFRVRNDVGVREVRVRGSPVTLRAAYRDVLPFAVKPDGVRSVHDGTGEETPKRPSGWSVMVNVLPSAR
jgi:hypothetical protein